MDIVCRISDTYTAMVYSLGLHRTFDEETGANDKE